MVYAFSADWDSADKLIYNVPSYFDNNKIDETEYVF